MKTKKIVKKLELNKTTITNLKNEELNHAQGGIYESHQISACTCYITLACCPTYATVCTCTCNPTGQIDCRCNAVSK